MMNLKSDQLEILLSVEACTEATYMPIPYPILYNHRECTGMFRVVDFHVYTIFCPPVCVLT